MINKIPSDDLCTLSKATSESKLISSLSIQCVHPLYTRLYVIFVVQVKKAIQNDISWRSVINKIPSDDLYTLHNATFESALISFLLYRYKKKINRYCIKLCQFSFVLFCLLLYHFGESCWKS